MERKHIDVRFTYERSWIQHAHTIENYDFTDRKKLYEKLRRHI